MYNIITATNVEHYQAAAQLFTAYAAWLNIDLCFQGFEAELRQLPQMYSQPEGCILLAMQQGQYVGCVAIRKKNDGVAELKRMYVQPDYVKQGIATALLQQALTIAKNLGYTKIWLDTLATMHPAINLYTKAGFYPIPAYYYNPQPNALFFELIL